MCSGHLATYWNCCKFGFCYFLFVLFGGFFMNTRTHADRNVSHCCRSWQLDRINIQHTMLLRVAHTVYNHLRSIFSFRQKPNHSNFYCNFSVYLEDKSEYSCDLWSSVNDDYDDDNAKHLLLLLLLLYFVLVFYFFDSKLYRVHSIVSVDSKFLSIRI